ncbi:MAG: hypothetical protein LBS60_07770 [Deltaproteobacteria bacterium]|nr:hypothetical protein [Deltaproteobacteria bacterium]
MSKQVMNVNVLAEFISNSYGASEVLVEKNNSIITIEPVSTDKSDSISQKASGDKPLKSISVDETKAGALSLDDFTEIQFSTKGFKFDRDEANARR